MSDILTFAVDGVTLNGEPLVVEEEVEWQEYCFVCRRCTDHVGEHDDLVEAGLAEYPGRYEVRWTAAATPERMAEWNRFDAFMAFVFNDYGWYYTYWSKRWAEERQAA